MQITEVFKKTLKHFIDPNIRIIFNYGGSSSSKTISILQIILIYALKHDNKTITICSQTLPKIKKGPLADFQKVILSQDGLNFLNTKKYFNKSELVYTLPNGSIIQFISADTEDKIIGLRSDLIYFDELNHIKKSIYDQLCIRTKYKILASWNPSSLFYANDEFDRLDTATIHSTYKDNPFVAKEIVNELITKGEKDKNFKRVYLEGKPGILEGMIFEEDINYQIVDQPPIKKIKKIIYGLDYGYVDPTALVKITLYEDKTIYVEEYLYKIELTPDTLLKELQDLKLPKSSKILAESARPELTDYLYKHKFNIHKVKKTTIIDGINKMYDYYMYVDINSKNLINELRNYAWAKDKNDIQLEKPIDNFNHCFRGDTIIKTNRGDIRIDEITATDMVLTRNGYSNISWVGITGRKKIKKYTFYIDSARYISIYITDGHLIKTKNDIWKKIEKINKGDIIFLHKSLMEKPTKNILMKNISQGVQKNYIELCGNSTMEKSQKDIIYTTKTTIKKIMKSKILNMLMGKNICQNIVRNGIEIIKNWLQIIYQKSDTSQRNGISHQRVSNGIENMQKNQILENQIYQRKNVCVVETFLNQKHIHKNSVQINARQNIEEIQEWMISPEYANIVENHLQQINIVKKYSAQDLVPIKIKRVECEEIEICDVYDITVDGLPEYFANGVLVHNCMDAIRYGQTMFKKQGSLKIY